MLSLTNSEDHLRLCVTAKVYIAGTKISLQAIFVFFGPDFSQKWQWKPKNLNLSLRYHLDWHKKSQKRPENAKL